MRHTSSNQVCYCFKYNQVMLEVDKLVGHWCKILGSSGDFLTTTIYLGFEWATFLTRILWAGMLVEGHNGAIEGLVAVGIVVNIVALRSCEQLPSKN